MNTHSPYKDKKGLKRVLHATRYSFSGLKAAFQLEAAFRQIIFLNVILLIVNACLDLSAMQHIILVMVGLIAVIVELLNSAIEAVVDRISLEHHELSKNAKDMGSAAQFVALSLIAITWFLVLWL